MCCKLFLGEVNDGGVPWKGKLSIVPLGKMLNHRGFFIWGVSYMLLVWLCFVVSFFLNNSCPHVKIGYVSLKEGESFETLTF